MIIRPIEMKDLNEFEKLAMEASAGLINLPKSREKLKIKIESSIKSFKKVTDEPDNEDYIFVLEDTSNGEIGGTCGIKSRTGVTHPLYFYRVENQIPKSQRKGVPASIQILRVVGYHEGPTEICSLYLTPTFRREGFGRLLSLCRFLFIANFPNRFQNKIIAEMRGKIDSDSHCPFWEGLGRHFLDVDFQEVMNLQYKGKEFVSEVIPSYPIYSILLSKEAQESIGKLHPDTKPALNMLIKEGFSISDEIDIFDGGPKVTAKVKDIRVIKESKVAMIDEIGLVDEDSDQLILSNLKMHFNACYGNIQILKEGHIKIPETIAKALNIKKGDQLRYVSPHASK